jgi:hypothetical protein
VEGPEQYFCFIKLYNDVWEWFCDELPENDGAKGIDNDCKDEIKEIAEC